MQEHLVKYTKSFCIQEYLIQQIVHQNENENFNLYFCFRTCIVFVILLQNCLSLLMIFMFLFPSAICKNLFNVLDMDCLFNITDDICTDQQDTNMSSNRSTGTKKRTTRKKCSRNVTFMDNDDPALIPSADFAIQSNRHNRPSLLTVLGTTSRVFVLIMYFVALFILYQIVSKEYK